MLTLIKLAILCYGAWWIYNKLQNPSQDATEGVATGSSTPAARSQSSESSSLAPLRVEVLETLLGTPDDDGDSECRVRVALTNEADLEIAELSFMTAIKSENGVTIGARFQQMDGPIAAGETRTLTITGGYIPFKAVLWGVTTSVSATGYGEALRSLGRARLPHSFEGPFEVFDRCPVMDGMDLVNMGAFVTETDYGDESGSATVRVLGSLISPTRPGVVGMTFRASIRSKGGSLLGESSDEMRVLVSGLTVNFTISVDDKTLLADAELEIEACALYAVAQGEGFGEGYEDDEESYEESDSDTEEDDEVSFDDDDDHDDDDDSESDDDEEYESDESDEDEDNEEESIECDSEEDSEDECVEEPSVEDSVALIKLQVQSKQVFDYAKRPNYPTPGSIERITEDFRTIELNLDPSPPCQCHVKGLTVRDIAVTPERIERTYEATIYLSADEDQYERVKKFMGNEGYLQGDVIDWGGAIASLIWDTNMAPEYAKYRAEERTISEVQKWVQELDGEEKRSLVTSLDEFAAGEGTSDDESSQSTSIPAPHMREPQAVDLTAFVRARQTFVFRDEEAAPPPQAWAYVKRDFERIKCSLDPKPPGVCEVTDVKVEDVNVSSEGIDRSFTCVVHISVQGEDLKKLQQFMIDEDYYDGGEINWSAAINAFLADVHECPEYASFGEERVTVDTMEVGTHEGAGGSSNGSETPRDA